MTGDDEKVLTEAELAEAAPRIALNAEEAALLPDEDALALAEAETSLATEGSERIPDGEPLPADEVEMDENAVDVRVDELQPQQPPLPIAPPTQGRIVLVKLAENEGLVSWGREFPAIVMQSLPEHMCNAKIFMPGVVVDDCWSIPHVDRAGADWTGRTWRWPDRS